MVGPPVNSWSEAARQPNPNGGTVEFQDYQIRYPDAPRPYPTKAGKGMFYLKIKSGIPLRWVNRACGTSKQWEADMIADLVEDIRRMGDVEWIDMLGCNNTMALSDLLARYLRRIEATLTSGETVKLDSQSVLKRIRAELRKEKE